MSYEVIKNFNGGLDARKFKLSQPAGTLTKLVNAHITAGGEIEKRKAFPKYADVSMTETGGTATAGVRTFGMQPTTVGLTVFGSALPYGTTPTQSQPVLAAAMPAGVAYQQLQHPAVLAGATYVAATHAMTAVEHSDNFGLAGIFVSAQFADGYVFAYYKGQLVNDFTAGLVLPYIYNGGTGTDVNLAKYLTSLVNNAAAYTAQQDINPLDYEFDTFGLPGNQYVVGMLISHTSNLTVISGNDTGYTTGLVVSTNGNNATAGSKVTIGGTIYTFKAAGTLASNGDVTIGANIAATATNLYQAINFTGTPNTDYKGTVANANVQATKLITIGQITFNLTAKTNNTLNATKNLIPGIGYAFAGATIEQQFGVNAIGQFDVSVLSLQAGTVLLSLVKSGGLATPPANASSITIGSQTYTFYSSIVVHNVPYAVKIDSDGSLATIQAKNTMASLLAAINGVGATGTDVGDITPANSSVIASEVATDNYSILLTGKTAGTAVSISQTGTTNYTSTASGIPGSGFTGITVGPVSGHGSLTTNGTIPADNSTVSIGTKTYTFRAAGSISSGSAEGDVGKGPSVNATLQNLIKAINQTGVQNVDYHVGTLNPDATALPSVTNGAIQLIARNPGAVTVALSVGGSANLTVSGATFTDGAATVQLLAATVLALSGQDEVSFANSVANAINAYTPTSGYTATALYKTVFISTKDTNSYSNDAIITTTSTGYCAVDFAGIELTASEHYNLATGGYFILLLDGLTAGSVNAGGANNDIPSVAAASAAKFNTKYAGVLIAIPIGSNIYVSRVVCASTKVITQVTGYSYYDSVTYKFILTSDAAVDGLVAQVLPGSVVFGRQCINPGESMLGGTGEVGRSFGQSFDVVGGGIASAIWGGTAPEYIVQTASPIIVTCKATGGIAPYKYNWHWSRGDNGFDVSDESAQSVNFSHKSGQSGAAAHWLCTVTDANNVSVDSNEVNILQPSRS